MVDIDTTVMEWTDNLTNLANVTNLTNMTDKEHDEYMSAPWFTKTWGYNLKTKMPSARIHFT